MSYQQDPFSPRIEADAAMSDYNVRMRAVEARNAQRRGVDDDDSSMASHRNPVSALLARVARIWKKS